MIQIRSGKDDLNDRPLFGLRSVVTSYGWQHESDFLWVWIGKLVAFDDRVF